MSVSSAAQTATGDVFLAPELFLQVAEIWTGGLRTSLRAVSVEEEYTTMLALVL